MSFLPFMSDIDDSIVTNKELEIYKDVAWNFKLNEPVIENGDFKIIEGNEALKVWIYKSIFTNRFEHEIYTWNYGCEIRSLIGQPYSKGLIESEAKRYIEEALLINDYILKVDIKEITFNEDTLKIIANIETIYGKMEVSY